MSPSTVKSEQSTRAVSLRVRDEIRGLIDQAARIQGRSRSDFMIDAARRAAEETLLDQTLVRVDQETYERFLAVLDQPPTEAGYQRLMSAPTPWSD
ncbi:type II toxin-antitoxin system TacA family antitoxin [Thiorhodovibrio litoralis]|uniref:type II toxin-antitoxin system TacA family antitoxin n=1 Tax=Thiorhodovibrio litoralis TaxID=2952932 RepID=UPI002B263C6B|nr:DUF1778 domain-containing protein [Thiorhodovibrio litoralis]WPL11493.1 hypothetical protein Thiosp_01228 [Thiorhodovibrio litoralis]